ncbi:hypothetical protein [Acuticoccus mangrovi]|uniref:Uncharacterized protein n=1 Tax=Acuticoccus mangrovi TaxID=2796142 RepID=A0A934IIN9_9HYPH|nr:hypothetical protein [Acuticoccus mangrovi]MBJ3777409.1 hypothetical protein [Acuticoccus mangrovi]
MVAGAYRCPVCGIDFPTGTPGAPQTPNSPAAVTPDGAPLRDTPQPRPDSLAARLEGALDEELVFVDETPTEDAPPLDATVEEELAEPEPDDVAEAPEDEVEHDDADLDDIDVRRDDPRAKAPPLGPVEPVRPRRGREWPATGSELAVTPAGRRGARKREPRVVIAAMKDDVAVRREEAREVMPTRRRRSKTGSLAGTLMLALLLLGVAGAGAWWLDVTGAVDLGITRRLVAPLQRQAEVTEVRAEDGWLRIPAATGTRVIGADGPFRVRIDGAVYTIEGGREVRVPVTEATNLSVRVVQSPTVAKVSLAP